ncbi:MAG: hypothetical protein DMD78_29540 [Candidatus Rokuibacteriota bacterium]|nr:MAG: hypothetical protein DMD78_29540 [Candidatus Rokubacteria bacterium]
MIRHRIAALTLAVPLLLSSAPAQAQRVLPLDPPIVLPPVSAPELRDAERVLEHRTPRHDQNRQDEAGLVGRDNPGLGYDVTSGIQQRAIEKALPR